MILQKTSENGARGTFENDRQGVVGLRWGRQVALFLRLFPQFCIFSLLANLWQTFGQFFTLGPFHKKSYNICIDLLSVVYLWPAQCSPAPASPAPPTADCRPAPRSGQPSSAQPCPAQLSTARGGSARHAAGHIEMKLLQMYHTQEAAQKRNAQAAGVKPGGSEEVRVWRGR